MAANSATAIPNAGMGAGTNNASAIVFRPIVWGDLDAVVDLFDRTWPQDVDKVGADMSRLISRYFVLHYLLPTTFANGAFAADGTLAGVTFIRVAGEAPQLDEIEVGEEMKALAVLSQADSSFSVFPFFLPRLQLLSENIGQKFIYDLCRPLLHIAGGVGVGVQRKGRPGMAQDA